MSYPLLDLALAEQLFAVADDKDIPDLRGLFAEFSADIPPRFATLKSRCDNPPADLAASQSMLHGLRGVVANFALSRAAQGLQQLETDWPVLSAADRSAGLRAAEADVHLGMEILREQFPYLGS